MNVNRISTDAPGITTHTRVTVAPFLPLLAPYVNANPHISGSTGFFGHKYPVILRMLTIAALKTVMVVIRWRPLTGILHR